MARYESEGTWFSAEERAKRERASNGAWYVFRDLVIAGPQPPRPTLDRLRFLHANMDRKGVTPQDAFRHLQDYHYLVGKLLREPAAPADPAPKSEAQVAAEIADWLAAHGLARVANMVRNRYQLTERR